VTNPSPKVYTFGYSGRAVSELLAYAQKLNAFVVDIRLKPHSQMAQWQYNNLVTTLSGRYHLIQALGNLNYQGGPIQIKNMAAGASMVRDLLKKKSVILLCACEDYHTCHRLTVAQHLASTLNVQVTHLPDPSIPLPTSYPAGYALSIKQPWAWLITNGHKDIENRVWKTNYRGLFMVHAGLSFDKEGYKWVRHYFPEIAMPSLDEFKLGGLVGLANMVSCVTKSNSKWFQGPYGFVLTEAKPYPFTPLKGQLKFFPV
jgi:hypothetical protein